MKRMNRPRSQLLSFIQFAIGVHRLEQFEGVSLLSCDLFALLVVALLL